MIRTNVKKTGEHDINKRIVIVSTDPLQRHKIVELNSPLRLTVDVPNAILDVPKKSIDIVDQKIRKVRVGQFQPNTVRLVMDLKMPLTYGLASNPSGRKLVILPSGTIPGCGNTD